MKITMTLYVQTREDWRAWLQAHHQTEREVWFTFYKKHTGQPSVPYGAAVEEALCFGWIDSLIQRVDDDKYVQKFTPRKNNRNWSALNISRMRKLIEAGRMTEAGLAVIPPGLLEAAPGPSVQRELAVPSWMEQALMAHPQAWANFNQLAPSYRRQYIGWVAAAKRDGTRQRRLEEAIVLLAQNKKLGMK